MENNKNQRLKKIFKKYLFLRGNKDDKAGKEEPTVAKKEDPPRKSSAAEKKADVTVESTDAVKAPPKVKSIQKKKKRIVNVEKAKKIEDEEKEEFEVVQNARPAVCHPLNTRKNKLQWKQEEQPQSESDTEQAEKAHDEIIVEKAPEKQMDPLKDAVAELTLEKQQLKDIIENLRKKMRMKNKLIEQLRKELGKEDTESTQEEREPKEQKEGETVRQLRQELEETKAALRVERAKTKADQEELQKLRKDKEEKPKEPVEEDKVIDEATLAVAKRTLELMKRNQLLENALGYKETSDLQKFFSTAAPNTQPNDNVLALLDKAMSVAMDTLAKRPHDLDDIIDNPMRRFINSPTAKEILLETMLSTQGMLPSSWAGEGGKEKKNTSSEGKKEYVVKSVYLYPPR